ncbi:AAA family ATPase [Zhongshania aliphaticivorans]|uniref:AAA family ATPase n=1 Tax=Zhongshania aliphaticivorans TaxID=1470434 RepID=UPI0012E5DB86|nr:AAA family ATPase [Zhongshania aliphaticivorans]CAA0103254.1 Uncharacterised protein [Zhongshania aliphaticivorans]
MNSAVNLVSSDCENRDLRAEIAALQKEDPKLSQAEIVRQSGVGNTVMSQWINGHYPGNTMKVEAAIARWIDAYKVRKQESKAFPKAPEWVATPSAERIISALGYAQLAGDISVVYGGAGLGKTSAIKQYQRLSPNVWVATMSSCTASNATALEEVVDALDMDAAGGAAKLRRAIIKRITGSAGLLVIDEAQHLSINALEDIRSIHDKTGIGIALVGNEAVYSRMTGGNRAAYLDRLFSRIGKRVKLTRSTKADIDTLIKAWKIDFNDCRTALHEIASKPGALRGMTKVLRMASMFAAGEGRDINSADIKAAWRDLGGE